MKRIYIYIIITAALAISCSKSGPDGTQTDIPSGEQSESHPIRFDIQDVALSKSGISEIDDIRGNIRIRGTRGGSVISKSETSTGYENIGIIQDSNTGLWKPDFTPEATWQYEDIERREVLDSTKNPPVSYNPKQYKDVKVVNNKYSFSAYSFNASVPSGAEPAPGLITAGDEFGMRIIGLSQPETYVHPTNGKPFGYDYVLSNRYDVNTSMSGGKVSGDVVKLHMEHALASVNVKFVVSRYVYNVKLLGIRLEGFYRTADMICTSQGSYSGASGNRNVWVAENLKDLYQGAGYERGKVNDPNVGALLDIYPDPSAEGDWSGILLDFCAIPQLLTKDCKLVMDFTIQQIADGPVTRMHNVWELFRYEDWKSGQRNNYTVRLNSSSELFSTIEPWIYGYEVSGTILP